ncbi:hypothetical protein [Bradyrhizobium ottawaense]|uniref:hypothetical protein n=1 Tax=Bradyrhizobium ottawaense TaxID=931866 RepID=UPI0024BF6394|nr:hypothetical protein [Bradyrhizobium ottawaense]
MSELFEGNNDWREKFPGRDEITSTIAFRVTHPLVDNAGDILLEHQLRIDGTNRSFSPTPPIRKRKPAQQRWAFLR